MYGRVATIPVMRNGERQPAIAEAAAHEIRRGDIAVLAAHIPQPRKNQKQQRIDEDGVGHREERHRAGAEGERRNRDEGVRGVDVAADQEPGDDGAEAPAAETPLVQLIEIALAPARGGEAEPGDEAEQQDEDDQRNPVHMRHDAPPFRTLLRLYRSHSRVAKYTTAVITALTMTQGS